MLLLLYCICSYFHTECDNPFMVNTNTITHCFNSTIHTICGAINSVFVNTDEYAIDMLLDDNLPHVNCTFLMYKYNEETQKIELCVNVTELHAAMNGQQRFTIHEQCDKQLENDYCNNPANCKSFVLVYGSREEIQVNYNCKLIIKACNKEFLY